MSGSGYDIEEIKSTYKLADIAAKYGAKLRQRSGKWTGCCPLPGHDDKSPSFAIVRGDNGYDIFKCLGCDRGGDVINFVMEMAGVDFQGACQILTGQAPSPKHLEAEPVDLAAGLKIFPPPHNDPPTFRPGQLTPPVFNPKSGKSPKYKPEAVYTYTNSDGTPVGYVLRVLWEDGKKFCPSIMWVRPAGHKKGASRPGRWAHFDMPRPRLYHLHDLKARPTSPVIITEGEKCADVAAELLPDMVSITWCGGTSQWQKAVWTPITFFGPKRRVTLWPDNDAPGRACMLGAWHGSNGALVWKPGLVETLLEIGCKVSVVKEPTQKPAGWDIADAKAEGFTADATAKYLAGMAEPWSVRTVAAYRADTKPPEQPSPVVQLHPVAQPVPDESDTPELAQASANVIDLKTGKTVDPGDPEGWQRELEPDSHGKPKAKSFQNFVVMIKHHPTLAGIFALNAFDHHIYLKRRPPWEPKDASFKPRALKQMDLHALRAHLEHICKVAPGQNDMLPALQLASNQCGFNSVVDYFDGLVWDREPRILSERGWLADYLGADGKALINQSYGMCWAISVVARAYEPGVKADCMLILEGKQGVGKSSAFEALAKIDDLGRYFTDSLPDFVSKDSKQLLEGKLIVEISELTAYRNTKDAQAVKMWLSRTDDDYRPPYGTVPQTFPRTCVFAGTVNPGGRGYLNDPTGERRFWPVAVTRIDLKRLNEDRDQLWAEAVHLYKEGIAHYLNERDEAVSEKVTALRQSQDVYRDKVVSHIEGLHKTTLADTMRAINLVERDQTPAAMERVANILHKLSMRRTMEKTPEGGDREVYIRLVDT